MTGEYRVILGAVLNILSLPYRNLGVYRRASTGIRVRHSGLSYTSAMLLGVLRCWGMPWAMDAHGESPAAYRNQCRRFVLATSCADTWPHQSRGASIIPRLEAGTGSTILVRGGPNNLANQKLSKNWSCSFPSDNLARLHRLMTAQGA